MAAYDDAFCDAAKITSYSGLGISATTNPTDTEVQVYARNRASAIRSELNKVNVTITVDVGANPVDITSDRGLAFRDMLTEANAVGAAIDQHIHGFIGVSPELSDKVKQLQARWEEMVLGRWEGKKFIRGTVIDAALGFYGQEHGRNPYSTGEIVEWTEDPTKEAPGIDRITLTGDNL